MFSFLDAVYLLVFNFRFLTNCKCMSNKKIKDRLTGQNGNRKF